MEKKILEVNINKSKSKIMKPKIRNKRNINNLRCKGKWRMNQNQLSRTIDSNTVIKSKNSLEKHECGL